MIGTGNEKDRQAVLRELQVNMNEEFRAVLQYICHRILAHGQDHGLAESFKTASLDEMSHILFFSDLISKYGGLPEFVNWQIDQNRDITAMLIEDIELEKSAKERYKAQIERFQGHQELVAVLQSVLSDEEDHEATFSAHLAQRQKTQPIR